MMDKDTFFRIKTTLNVGGRILDLSKPQVMGILNITPDSFFSGSRFNDEKEIEERVAKLLSEGASIIDVGAYSSRPGAEDVSEEEELQRLIPVVRLLKSKFPNIILSIDTFRSKVAEEAIKSGAHIINDISGGELDKNMFATVGKLSVPYILMHMRGNPKTMTSLTDYNDLLLDIVLYFSEKINRLKSLGVKDIILDPGFGFAKNAGQNYRLLKDMDNLRVFGLPILAGLSRKTMIWKTLHIKPEEALNGTSVLNVLALQKGASILRVHDVLEAKQCIELMEVYNKS
ncbi:Dihydropteroate synthase [Pseudopedobacter saltans DSM 12145]|uniref:dihydropteroate synthase n=1 Tax=Pseudopedobacter saltans (strain ATCC 51119 / DSM 12145 / JCM 21818 / CCUG 39354 / LMG 10337 / NBRC 100064 / NCIMB 13643) TaxID=762903 RepID=F0S5N5_PSESL|nr:dihydropteroate synthase [Pseudopedobacter saltans]ADY54209.1 Dihydropteroate synthase [Pseudopedobacter saltans DSM 12145]